MSLGGRVCGFFPGASLDHGFAGEGLEHFDDLGGAGEDELFPSEIFGELMEKGNGKPVSHAAQDEILDVRGDAFGVDGGLDDDIRALTGDFLKRGCIGPSMEAEEAHGLEVVGEETGGFWIHDGVGPGGVVLGLVFGKSGNPILRPR